MEPQKAKLKWEVAKICHTSLHPLTFAWNPENITKSCRTRKRKLQQLNSPPACTSSRLCFSSFSHTCVCLRHKNLSKHEPHVPTADAMCLVQSSCKTKTVGKICSFPSERTFMKGEEHSRKIFFFPGWKLNEWADKTTLEHKAKVFRSIEIFSFMIVPWLPFWQIKGKSWREIFSLNRWACVSLPISNIPTSDDEENVCEREKVKQHFKRCRRCSMMSKFLFFARCLRPLGVRNEKNQF